MDNPPSTFDNLPSEVCEAILKQLGQEDALKLRLVNKRWKVLVDELYSNWSINIDKKCPDLKRILNLKIKKVNITELIKHLPFLCLPVRGISNILKYPDILENLSMPLEYEVKPVIAPQYLNRLLHHSKNLKYLCLNLNKFNLVKRLNHEPTSYDLAKLLDLKIRIQSFHRACPENNAFGQIMNRSDLSNLRSLEFNIIQDDGGDSFWRIVFLFLQAAKSNCKNLISLTVGGSIKQTRDLVSTDVDVGKCFSTLQNLVIYLSSRGGLVAENWKKFIECQTALKNFEVSHYFSISSLLLSNVILKNFKTLKSIQIFGLEAVERMLEDGVSKRYFNLEIFQNCQNLETLDLFLDGGEMFINFNRLSANLKKISLRWGLLDSDEILDFFTRPNKVTTLYISRAGTSGRFGFNGTILDVWLELEGLKSISVEDNCINSSVKEEKEKLKRIYASSSRFNRTRTEIVNGNEVIKFGQFYKGWD